LYHQIISITINKKPMLKKFQYILLLSLLSWSTLLGQTWQQKVLVGGAENYCSAVTLAPNGGYLFTGSLNSNAATLFYHTDKDGKKLILKTYTNNNIATTGNDILLDDNSYIVVGRSRSDASFSRFDIFGNRTLEKIYGGIEDDEFYKVTKNINNDFYAVGTSQNMLLGKFKGYLSRFNAAGDTIFTKQYGNDKTELSSLDYNSDGSLILVGNTVINTDRFGLAIKIDANGNIIWSKTYGLVNTKFKDVVINRNDGGIYLCGIQNGKALLFKLDSDGSKLWEKSINTPHFGELRSLIIQDLSKLVAVGYTEIVSNTDALLAITDLNGNVLLEKNIGSNSQIEDAYDITLTDDKHFIIAGSSTNTTSLITDALILKTDAAGNILTNSVEGNIYYDVNNNGIKDGVDKNLGNWVVQIEHSNKTTYASTNTDGKFHFNADTGSYKILIKPINENWTSNRLAYDINIVDSFSTISLSMPVINNYNCSKLYADISTSAIQPCKTNEYVISYENKGPLNAKDAYIIVKIDDRIAIQNSSIAWTSRVGNLLRYDLGFLNLGAKGSIKLGILPECNPTEIGLTYQSWAHIYPDTLCDTNVAWDRSSLEVEGNCIGDQVAFKIKNKGTGPSKADIQYIVIEDDIMYIRQPVGTPISPNDSITVIAGRVPGKTLRLVTDQSTNHPDMRSTPTWSVEGCRSNIGLISKGFKTMLPENDSKTTVDIDNIESTNINSSLNIIAQPKGYDKNNTGINHFITKATDLEYLIPFENKSNDTLRSCIIIDTLSTFINPANIEMGSSSHTFSYEVYTDGIIKFIFDNLNMAPNGAGFVKFRTTQKPNNPNAAIIYNKADIYYNYQKPITTTTTKHTIGVDFIEVILKTINPIFPDLELTVAPNPMVDEAYITIKNATNVKPNVQLQLFDITGKPIKVFESLNYQFHLFRNELPAGVYFFQLTETNGLSLGSGKIIMN
jgi:hypothetical protein